MIQTTVPDEKCYLYRSARLVHYEECAWGRALSSTTAVITTALRCPFTRDLLRGRLTPPATLAQGRI